MESTITFKRDNKNVKKSLHPKNGVFLIYASRQFKISPMQFQRYHTKVIVALPKNSCGYFTSKFKTEEIEQVCNDTQQIWIRILNRSLTEEIVINKKQTVCCFFRFCFCFFLETKGKIKIKHETTQKTKKTLSKILKKEVL